MWYQIHVLFLLLNKLLITFINRYFKKENSAISSTVAARQADGCHLSIVQDMLRNKIWQPYRSTETSITKSAKTFRMVRNSSCGMVTATYSSWVYPYLWRKWRMVRRTKNLNVRNKWQQQQSTKVDIKQDIYSKYQCTEKHCPSTVHESLFIMNS